MSREISFNGRLTADPEYNEIGDRKTPICELRVASNEKKYSNGELVDDVIFYKVKIWGKQAQNVNKYLKKGLTTWVKGDLTKEFYDRKDGSGKGCSEVVDNARITFIHSKQDEVDTSNTSDSSDENTEEEDENMF